MPATARKESAGSSAEPGHGSEHRAGLLLQSNGTRPNRSISPVRANVPNATTTPGRAACAQLRGCRGGDGSDDLGERVIADATDADAATSTQPMPTVRHQSICRGHAADRPDRAAVHNVATV